MYCLIDFCCICFCNKEHLQHLSDSDSDNITYLTKLTSCFAEMCFNELNDQWFVCNKCCETMDVVYKFRQRCLRSKTTLTDYISQLRQVSNISGTTNIYLTDINKFVDIKKEYPNENNIKKMVINVNEATNEKVNSKINLVTEIKRKNSPFTSKLIDTGEDRMLFENVVVKMEREDTFLEENIGERLTNPLVNQDGGKIIQNDILTASAIKTENQDIQEHLHGGSDNILKTCDSANDDMENKIEKNYGYSMYSKKCSDDPLINLDEIKIDIVDHDIESVNAEMNIEYKSEFNEDVKGDHVIALRDEDKTDNDTTSNHSINPPFKTTTTKLSKHRGTLTPKLKETKRKQHECTICEKKFTQSLSLSEHMRTHTGEKPHACTICQKKFAQSSNLREHMRIHTGEKPHTCTICQKKFTHSTNLKTHLKIHTRENLHECSVCEKKFTQYFTLREHVRTHTKEKPHECVVCGKSFAQSSNLRQHMRTHTGDRRHECSVCLKKFTRSAHLKKHMKIHAREKQL